MSKVLADLVEATEKYRSSVTRAVGFISGQSEGDEFAAAIAVIDAMDELDSALAAAHAELTPLPNPLDPQ